VRWSGAKAVAEFIDELTAVARKWIPTASARSATFRRPNSSGPATSISSASTSTSTRSAPLRTTVARLQMMADTKPLMLGEVGIDSRGEGEDRQA
jgi:hypothetical protein